MNYVIIDGNLAAHKSFHIYKQLSSVVDGKRISTGVTYGLLKTIMRINEFYAPCRTAVVFDSSMMAAESKIIPTDYIFDKVALPLPVRNKILNIYKNGRIGPDTNIVCGVWLLRRFLELMNVSIFYSSYEWEADDVIAYLVHRCKLRKSKHKSKIVIVSDDKDFFQLIEDHSEFEIIMHRRGDDVVSEKSFKKKFGFNTKHHIDYLAMMGDDVDNIPGIKGVGPKTAASIVKAQKYRLDITGANWDIFLRNKELIQLRESMDTIQCLRHFELKNKELEEILRRYKMLSLLRYKEQGLIAGMKNMDFVRMGE